MDWQWLDFDLDGSERWRLSLVTAGGVELHGDRITMPPRSIAVLER
jgi:hypothetical protein